MRALVLLLCGFAAAASPTHSPATRRRAPGVHRPPASLRVLPGSAQPSQIGTGQLVGSRGQAFVDTRTGTKACDLADGGLVILAANTPCVDSNGLNIEPAATTYQIHSQQMDLGPTWTTGAVTVTADTTVAPDGTLTAETVTDDGTNTQHLIATNAMPVPSNGSYIFSVFLQATGTDFCVALGHNGNAVDFNLRTGAVVVTDGLAVAFPAKKYGNWWRFAEREPFVTGGTDYDLVVMDPTCSSTFPAYVGTGSSIHPWGADIDPNVAPTSYIPTTTVTLTRGTETVLSSSTVRVGATPSFSADVVPVNVAVNTQILPVYVSGTDRWDFIVTSASKVLCQYYNGTTAPTITSAASVTVGSRNHVSCSYNGTTLKVCVNGACTSGARTIAPLSTSYTVDLGLYGSGAGNSPWGALSNVCVDSTPTGCQ